MTSLVPAPVAPAAVESASSAPHHFGPTPAPPRPQQPHGPRKNADERLKLLDQFPAGQVPSREELASVGLFPYCEEEREPTAQDYRREQARGPRSPVQARRAQGASSALQADGRVKTRMHPEGVHPSGQDWPKPVRLGRWGGEVARDRGLLQGLAAMLPLPSVKRSRFASSRNCFRDEGGARAHEAESRPGTDDEGGMLATFSSGHPQDSPGDSHDAGSRDQRISKRRRLSTAQHDDETTDGISGGSWGAEEDAIDYCAYENDFGAGESSNEAMSPGDFVAGQFDADRASGKEAGTEPTTRKRRDSSASSVASDAMLWEPTTNLSLTIDSSPFAEPFRSAGLSLAVWRDVAEAASPALSPDPAALPSRQLEGVRPSDGEAPTALDGRRTCDITMSDECIVGSSSNLLSSGVLANDGRSSPADLLDRMSEEAHSQRERPLVPSGSVSDTLPRSSRASARAASSSNGIIPTAGSSPSPVSPQDGPVGGTSRNMRRSSSAAPGAVRRSSRLKQQAEQLALPTTVISSAAPIPTSGKPARKRQKTTHTEAPASAADGAITDPASPPDQRAEEVAWRGQTSIVPLYLGPDAEDHEKRLGALFGFGFKTKVTGQPRATLGQLLFYLPLPHKRTPNAVNATEKNTAGKLVGSRIYFDPGSSECTKIQKGTFIALSFDPATLDPVIRVSPYPSASTEKCDPRYLASAVPSNWPTMGVASLHDASLHDLRIYIRRAIAGATPRTFKRLAAEIQLAYKAPFDPGAPARSADSSIIRPKLRLQNSLLDFERGEIKLRVVATLDGDKETVKRIQLYGNYGPGTKAGAPKSPLYLYPPIKRYPMLKDRQYIMIDVRGREARIREFDMTLSTLIGDPSVDKRFTTWRNKLLEV